MFTLPPHLFIQRPTDEPYARNGFLSAEMPVWARLQLAAQGIPFRRVTHFVRSSDGDTIGATVRGEPVWLRKSAG